MQTVEHHDAEFVHDSLRNIQPNDLHHLDAYGAAPLLTEMLNTPLGVHASIVNELNQRVVETPIPSSTYLTPQKAAGPVANRPFRILFDVGFLRATGRHNACIVATSCSKKSAVHVFVCLSVCSSVASVA